MDLMKKLFQKKYKNPESQTYNQLGNIIINIYNSKLLKNLLGDDQYK